MITTARKLGGFFPGAEPRYLAPGSALHICGTYRAGELVEESVVNKYGVVHGRPELVLGGCRIIPTQNASTPTLTAAAFTVAAVEEMLKAV